MGYKKLDEIMELLNDELDGFNKAIDKLELLTKNTDKIKIQPDTSKIEEILGKHLNSKKDMNIKIKESILNIEKQVTKARLLPKAQLWLHYSIWIISFVIIGYLTFKISRIDDIQEKAFTKGEQQVILKMKGYFEQNPKHYQSYQNWVKEKDSAPNQK